MNLTSSTYPMKYLNNLDCIHVVNVPNGFKVHVEIVDMDLANGDYLHIENDMLTGSIKDVPSTYISSNSTSEIRFTTNLFTFGQRRGFLLELCTIHPDGELVLTNSESLSI